MRDIAVFLLAGLNKNRIQAYILNAPSISFLPKLGYCIGNFKDFSLIRKQAA